jgi:hypothetical protein
MFKNETSIEDWEDIDVFPEETKDEEVNVKATKSNLSRMVTHVEQIKSKKFSNLKTSKFEDSK